MTLPASPGCHAVIHHRQRTVPVDRTALSRLVRAAIPLVHAEALGEVPLPAVVEVSIVSDRAIGRVHARFLGDPSPTDVITFQHGELLVSADTAARSAPEFGHSTEEELALYIIHGMLHLLGHDDHEPRRFRVMAAAQARVLRAARREVRSRAADTPGTPPRTSRPRA